jgi:arylsulfatase A-like enzyme
VLFRSAYSPAPWTQPAIASLLTGLMPSAHGLVHLFDRLDDGVDTLAEQLQRRGFDTSAVVSHTLLEPKYGFGQGFTDFDDSAADGHQAITSDKVTDNALGWLDGWKQRADHHPFFLFVHYFDPHYVYRHHERFDRTSGYQGPLKQGMGIWELRDARATLTQADVAFLVGLYREEVAFTDFHLGRLLDGLLARGLSERTLVVVAADHGEEFMNHGWIGHTRTLYDELLHVPLVVALPATIAPRTVDAPVSLLDVVPTLLALSRKPAPPPTGGGVSLAGVLAGKASPPAARDLFAEVSFLSGPDEPQHLAQKTAYKTAVLEGPLRLIHDLAAGSWEMFDRTTDPEEHHDLFARHPARPRLQRQLLAWERKRDAGGVAGRPGALTPTAEDLARLRALGYLR